MYSILQSQSPSARYIFNHNPYVPICRNDKGWSDVLRQKREVNHVRRLVGQWQQCAEKSKVARMKELYEERLSCVQEVDKIFWEQIVYKIEVDITRQQQPKMYFNEEEERRLTAHKRKEDGQLSPDRATPNSAERKPKGPRCQEENAADVMNKEKEEGKDMEEGADSEGAGDVDEDLEMTPPEISAKTQREDGNEKTRTKLHPGQ